MTVLIVVTTALAGRLCGGCVFLQVTNRKMLSDHGIENPNTSEFISAKSCKQFTIYVTIDAFILLEFHLFPFT